MDSSDDDPEEDEEITEPIVIQMVPENKVRIAHGGTVKITANITCHTQDQVNLSWLKVENNIPITLATNTIKYSGSCCSMPSAELVVNNIGHGDQGVYQLEVSSHTLRVVGPPVVLEIFGDPVDAIDEEETNYLKLYLLCYKLAAESVQLYFNRHVPEPSLVSHLTTWKTSLDSGYHNRCKWKCTRPQHDVLFPTPPTIPVSTNFDFSLKYKLVRNTLGVPSPSRGWGNSPSPGDTSCEDDIERIRDFRNLLAHNTSLKVSDTDFGTMWTDLSQAVNRLSVGALTSDIRNLEKQKMDREIKNQLLEEIRTSIEDIQREVELLRQEVVFQQQRNINYDSRLYELESAVPTNIRRVIEKQLEDWKKDDEVYVSATRVCKCAFNVVQSSKMTIFIGGPGSGKSATSRHIALQYGRDGWDVIPVSILQEVCDYADPEAKQVFLMDDVFGVYSVDTNVQNSLERYKSRILYSLGLHSKLLCSSRKSIYKEMNILDPFWKTFELDSKELMLNEEEKRNVLQVHCEKKKIPEQVYRNVPLTSDFMFPFLCYCYASNSAYQRCGDRFFQKPHECVLADLDRLQTRNPIQYASLVICLMANKQLQLTNELEKEMKEDALNACRVNLGTPDLVFIDALGQLCGTYVHKSNEQFSFIHDSMEEIFGYHFGKDNVKLVIKYMSPGYVWNKIIVSDPHFEGDADPLCILVHQQHYHALAKRFYNDIKDKQPSKLYTIFKNKSLSNNCFVDAVMTHLKTISHSCFKKLLDTREIEVSYVSRKEDETTNKTDMTDDIQNFLIHFQFSKKPGIFCHYSVRVIRYVVHFGHVYFLRCINDYVKSPTRLTARSILDVLTSRFQNITNLQVFGDENEKIRLLVLACFGSNISMVKFLIEDFGHSFINKGIDSDSNKHTPFTAACTTGNLPLIQYLVACGGDITSSKDVPLNPLSVVVKNGYVDVVRFFLDKVVSIENYTLALPMENMEIFKLLVEHGADLNTQNYILPRASSAGNIELVKFLISKHVDIDTTDPEKETALFKAAEHGYDEIVAFLLANGCQLDLFNCRQRTPLHKAAEKGHLEIIKALVEKGASVNSLNILNSSPVFVASENGNFEVVSFLIRNGADIHKCNFQNKSPLYIASANGLSDIVACLVENGSDVNQCDLEGTSPVLAAVKAGHIETSEMLIEKGADITEINIEGLNVLYASVVFNDIEVLTRVLKKKNQYYFQRLNDDTIDSTDESTNETERINLNKSLLKCFVDLKEASIRFLPGCLHEGLLITNGKDMHFNINLLEYPVDFVFQVLNRMIRIGWDKGSNGESILHDLYKYRPHIVSKMILWLLEREYYEWTNINRYFTLPCKPPKDRRYMLEEKRALWIISFLDNASMQLREAISTRNEKDIKKWGDIWLSFKVRPRRHSI